jgi:hypothetical protein
MKRVARFGLAVLCAAALAASASALEPRPGVRVRALDKVTGTATDISLKIGETVAFGRISLTARACYASPPEDTPESVAFMEIRSLGPSPNSRGAKERKDKGEKPVVDPKTAPTVFSGWMYASTPGLSALEHPVYDVWVIQCSAAAPQTLPDLPPAPGAAPGAPATTPTPQPNTP